MAGTRRSQMGIALLLLLLIACIFGTTLFLAAMSTSRQKQMQDNKTQAALEQAKEALIGDAATYMGAAYLPGRLRCPEQLSISSPQEGQAQLTCTTTARRLGRFPWSSLHMDKLLDGYGEPLWYAVSPGFSAFPINSNSVGLLTVDNTLNAAVALIIAPGPALQGQNRNLPSASTPPQPGDYLESSNASGGPFITTGAVGAFNDRVLVVTQADLFQAANRRVLAEIRGLDDQAPNPPAFGLRGYYNSHGQFPPAATPMSSLPYDPSTLSWLTNNNWFSVITYTRISPSSATISIGSTSLNISPCSSLPCP